MANSKEEIVETFFDGYKKKDISTVKKVMAENVEWHFPGDHPMAGVKKGIEQVLAFFDLMGSFMKKANPDVEKLIVASNEFYLIECQQIRTHRTDGINIHHYVTVLWTFKDDKITEGRHFFADQEAANKYFNAVARAEKIS